MLAALLSGVSKKGRKKAERERRERGRAKVTLAFAKIFHPILRRGARAFSPTFHPASVRGTSPFFPDARREDG
jgi:hypothetical protein